MLEFSGMKNVSAEDGFLVFQKFFTDLLRLEVEMVVWQVSTTDGKRRVHRSVLTSFKYEQGRLHLQNAEGKEFDFQDDVLFCWAEKDGVIFKTTQIPTDGGGLSLKLPEKLCFLEGPELTVIQGGAAPALPNTDAGKVKPLPGQERSGHDLEILKQGLDAMTLAEEDKLYADKREAPRVRAKGNKVISVCLADRPETSTEQPLFDLSRGGLAFVVEAEKRFQKGDMIFVLEIENNRLDSPLVGEVMSVRKLDDESGYKVGVKFVDEI